MCSSTSTSSRLLRRSTTPPFCLALRLFFFFFNDTATTEIYTLSLHDALPICLRLPKPAPAGVLYSGTLKPSPGRRRASNRGDRKSTRLNSSHLVISYAVFCLKKKKNVHSIADLVYSSR